MIYALSFPLYCHYRAKQALQKIRQRDGGAISQPLHVVFFEIQVATGCGLMIQTPDARGSHDPRRWPDCWRTRCPSAVEAITLEQRNMHKPLNIQITDFLDWVSSQGANVWNCRAEAADRIGGIITAWATGRSCCAEDKNAQPPNYGGVFAERECITHILVAVGFSQERAGREIAQQIQAITERQRRGDTIPEALTIPASAAITPDTIPEALTIPASAMITPDTLPRVVDAMKRLSELRANPIKEASQKRPRKRRQVQQKMTLTGQQLIATQIFGECECNYTRGAKKMGIGVSAFRQHVEAAYKKLGQQVPAMNAKTQSLTTGSRGEVNIAAGTKPDARGKGDDRKGHDRRFG